MTKFVNILGKFFVVLFLGILIIGLVAWGIGDVIKSNNSGKVAEVGNSAISSLEIDKIVNEQKRLYVLRGGVDISPELESFLRQSALRQIINTRLLENELQNLGVEFEPDHIIKKEYTDAKTGEVKEPELQRDIANYGGEEAFVKELVKTKKIDALETSMTSIIPLQDSYVRKIYNYNKQQRDIKLVEFNGDFLEQTVTPKDTEILSFYEERKNDYSSPEYRSVSYILIDKSSIKNPSKDLAEDIYETANDLLDKLAEGASLEDAAKELDLKFGNVADINKEGKDKSNNMVKLPELLNFHDVIFSSQQDEVSDLLESKDGLSYGVLRVDDIEPSRIKSLSEVRGKVTEDFKKYSLFNLLFEKVSKVKNDLASGKIFLSSLEGQRGVKISNLENLERNSQKLPTNFVNLIFDAKNFSETFPDNGKIFIAKIEKVKEPKEIDELELLDVRSMIEDQISQEIMMQYVNYLAGKYKVSISQ